MKDSLAVIDEQSRANAQKAVALAFDKVDAESAFGPALERIKVYRANKTTPVHTGSVSTRSSIAPLRH